MKKIIAYVTSHGHMDIEWYQPLDTFRYWMSEAVEMLDEFQKEYPDQTYIFDGAFFPVEAVLKLHPEYEDIIRRLVKDRKLLVGPFYTQFDEFLNSGETIVSNCLYGDRLSKDYGSVMKAGYLPDNFGHPSQLPQIFRGFGIDNILFTRGMVDTKQGKKEFRFIGDDGTFIYGVNFAYYATFSIYTNNDPKPGAPSLMPGSKYFISDFSHQRLISDHRDNKKIAEELIKNVREHAKYYPSGIVPMFMGADHCPPQKDILKTIALANSMQDDIEFVFGDGDGYSEFLRNNAPDTLDEFKGNLLGLKTEYVLLGAMTSRTYLKRQHNNCEHIMFDYALPSYLIAKQHGFNQPTTMLNDAMKKLLINSTHDTIHGSSLDTVHVEQEYRYSSIMQNGMWTFHQALEDLGNSMTVADTNCDGAFMVFTPVGVKNSICEAYIVTNEKNVTIYDSNGKKIDCDIIPNPPMEYNVNGDPALTPYLAKEVRKVRFEASGNATVEKYTYTMGDEENTVTTQPSDTIENKFFKITFNKNTIDVFDKEQGVSYNGLNQLFEMADAGDIWDFSEPWTDEKTFREYDFDTDSVSVTKGNISSTLSYSYTMLLPEKMENGVRSNTLIRVPVSFDVTIYNNVKRIDVSVKIQNRACDHCVRLRIPNVNKEENVLTAGLFTTQQINPDIYFNCENVGTASNREMPFRDFVSYKNQDIGLITAVKGLYTYEYKDNAIEIPLFRSVGKMTKPNMKGRMPGSFCSSLPIDDAQCLRELTFEFSYIPVEKDKTVKAYADTIDGYLRPAFVHPLKNIVNGTLPQAFSPVEIEKSDNVTVSVFRETYDADGAVLRVFETMGETAAIKVKSSIYKKFYIANMNEEIMSSLDCDNDGYVNLEIGPHKIITILMKEG